MSARDLKAKFENKTAHIGIIGMGYVGLPLALTAVARGYKVTGFDTDPAKVSDLNEGKSYIEHIDGARVAEARDTNKFAATVEMSMINDCDALLLAVPTPLDKSREPDMRFVIDTTKAVAAHLRADQLIVLESTTYPGTTTELMRPILEQGGLKSATDFFLAYSPEREDPGNPNFDTATIPKVVGGDGVEATELASALYGNIVNTVVPVSSTETAEAVKLTENIFRSVNIALVNELKIIYERMGIDVWEVINAAKTKPFGFMPFYPGPGLGGHCIPIDPFYLTWRARQFDVPTRFIELAGEINTHMPHHVITRLAESLDRMHGKALSRSKILILGAAYKKNVDDMRESPSLKLMELLNDRGAAFDYHDPHVPVLPPSREHPELTGIESVSLDQVADYDAVLISTDHDKVDYDALVGAAQLVIDTRNACTHVVAGREKIVKA